jgi:PAS domain S-box-containing protein
LDSINDNIIVLDKNGNITYLNAACAETLSLKKSDIGKNIWKLQPSLVNTPIHRSFLEVIDKPETKIVHWKSLKPERLWEIKFLPSNEGVIAIFRDIEGKNAKTALIESEERYRNLVENSKDAITLVDFKGNVLFVNRAAETLTGYPLNEITNIRDVTPKKLWLKSVSTLLRARLGKPIPYFEYEIKRKDGTIVPVETGGQAILKNGKPVAIQIITRDITERKKAQQVLADRNKKLAESEARFRELYDSFGQAFIATDWDLNVTHWNKAAERLTKVKASQAVGKKICAVVPKAFIDVDRFYGSLRAGKTVHYAVTTESKETVKQLIFEISIYPSTNGILYTIEDKTEQETTRRLSAIGAMAGMVGHDIRNPLQAIVADVFLIKSNLVEMQKNELNDEIQESLESIENNISYINKIVADLQDYARPLTPEIKDVDLSDLFAVICRTIKAPENIVLTADSGNLKLKTDPELVRRVIINLVTNAIQALPNGGKVDLVGFEIRESVFITVSDNGVGIPEEVKPKLFTPMVTTKSKGQGFGLAVVKRLVEALGGSITFESEVGKGTKFIIMLPKTN